MGGDNAPYVTIRGAVQALRESKNRFDVLLVGQKEVIKKIIVDEELPFPEGNIIHATEVVSMDDIPSVALKTKPKSSVAVCADLVKSGNAHAMVSAGNTGAVMAIATFKIGRIEGISRPAIGSLVPTLKNPSLAIDMGANSDCKPSNLFEFALMGSVYMKEMFGVDNPKIGLLSVGEEDSKGNEVTIQANKLLRQSNLNFYGNIEGRDILKGEVDVIVCDGFVGNIVLKFAEGFLYFILKKLKKSASENILNKIKLGFSKGVLKEILGVFDYQQYGGIPLFGVNGVVVIGHGSSTEVAVKNMIIRGYEIYKHNVVNRIKEAIENYYLKVQEG